MKKSKTYYIGSFQLPDENASANRVLAVSELLTSLGEEIYIWSLCKQKYDNSEKIEFYEKKYNYKIKFIVGNQHSLLKKIYNDKKEGIEVSVICYNLRSDIFITLMLFSCFFNIKIISDITEWYSTNLSGFLKNILKWSDTVIRMRLLNNIVKYKIVVSPFLNNFYATKVKKKMTTMIEVPTILPKKIVSSNVVPKRSNSEIVEFFYAGDPFRYTGKSIDKSKMKERIDLLVEYISSNENVKLKIFGITQQQYLDSIPEHNEIVNKMKCNILFGGRVNRDVISEELQSADFMIILREKTRMNEAGFPTKFTEAMKNGIPVLTTKATDISKYFIEGKHGYYIDIDSDLYSSINSVIQSVSKEKIFSMKKACLSNDILNNESYLEKLKKIYV